MFSISITSINIFKLCNNARNAWNGENARDAKNAKCFKKAKNAQLPKYLDFKSFKNFEIYSFKNSKYPNSLPIDLKKSSSIVGYNLLALFIVVVSDTSESSPIYFNLYFTFLVCLFNCLSFNPNKATLKKCCNLLLFYLFVPQMRAYTNWIQWCFFQCSISDYLSKNCAKIENDQKWNDYGLKFQLLQLLSHTTWYTL